MLDDLEQATASTNQTLDHPRVLLLRTQVATDSAPWLPTELYLTQVKKGRWGANKEPANPLPPLFAEAAGHACAVCARSALIGASISRCGRCKTVRYCSSDCAKAHWPVHKDICKELADAPIPNRKEDYFQQLSPAASYFYRRRARCTICQDASSKLSICKRCFGAAYCAKCVTTHPKDECDASILEQCCLGLISDMGAPLSIPSRTPFPSTTKPSGWKAYFEAKMFDFEVDAGLLALGPPCAMLTEALSLPIVIAEFLPKNASVVHVIGAAPADLVGVRRFREVFRWRPDLARLAVCMVGPLLRQVTEKQPPEDGCERLLVLEARGGPYATTTLPPPDLVVLYDMDAAAVALQRGKSLVALASTREDADAMHAALSDQTDRPVAPPRENPFRGLRPRRAAAPAAGYVYANHWVVVVGGA